MPTPYKLALALALIAFPLLEIALLIRASRWLGLTTVALIVILTAVAGAAVIQREGLKTVARTLATLQAGRSGLEPMLDGLLRVTAGVLLIFPGLVTDILGLALLVPLVRTFVIKAGFPRLIAGTFSQTEIFERRFETDADTGDQHPAPPGAVVIEGEYERIDEPTKDSKPAGQPRRS
jgi:UPF0716 protein FxsA